MKVLKSNNFNLFTSLCPGHRVCVVGDVHGHVDHLKNLLTEFSKKPIFHKKTSLILLGDLIDRGPENLMTLELVTQASNDFDEVILLMGNHEQMLLKSISELDLNIFSKWLRNGGSELARELELNLDHNTVSLSQLSLFISRFGEQNRLLLEEMKSHHHIGNLIFTHAGTHPHKSLIDHFAQPWNDINPLHWAWIRTLFLKYPVEFEDNIVIHGHTPVREKFDLSNINAELDKHLIKDNKLNLDGGSYMANCVTGAEFSQSSYQIIISVPR